MSLPFYHVRNPLPFHSPLSTPLKVNPSALFSEAVKEAVRARTLLSTLTTAAAVVYSSAVMSLSGSGTPILSILYYVVYFNSAETESSKAEAAAA